MSNQYYFNVPFANGGDTTVIPSAAQPDNSVSMATGWGADYQRDLSTDPLAKSIDRGTTNWLFNAITQALGALQLETFPEWIPASQTGGTQVAYDKGATVLYSEAGTVPFTKYVSLITNNTDTPGATANWQVVVDAIATASQAAAGTDNTTLITPLRMATQLSTRALLAGNSAQVFNVAPPTASTQAVPAGSMPSYNIPPSILTVTGSVVVPGNAVAVYVTAAAPGGGGGGGAGSTTNSATFGSGAGGGGAGQSITKQRYLVTPGQSITATIGVAGTAGTAGGVGGSGGVGGNGGNLVLSGTGFNSGTSLTLTGGSGGSAGNISSSSHGGGAGGAGYPNGSDGLDSYIYITGGTQIATGAAGGGAGASSLMGGGGGSGRGANGAGNSGYDAYGYGSGGGGGGGSYTGAAGGGAGGAGAPGIAILEWALG